MVFSLNPDFDLFLLFRGLSNFFLAASGLYSGPAPNSSGIGILGTSIPINASICAKRGWSFSLMNVIATPSFAALAVRPIR